MEALLGKMVRICTYFISAIIELWTCMLARPILVKFLGARVINSRNRFSATLARIFFSIFLVSIVFYVITLLTGYGVVMDLGTHLGFGSAMEPGFSTT